jgi:ABC-2 type transport system permease protein
VAQADTEDAAEVGDAGDAAADSGSSETADDASDAASEESGDDTADTSADEEPEGEVTEPEEKEKRPIDVVYVADIDLMISTFLRIRARPGEDEEINWDFENVNFLLNVIDVLSGDVDYIDIRKRKPHHSTLRMVERRTQEMREQEFEKRYEFQQEFEKAIEETEEENRKSIEKVQKELEELQEKARQEGQAGISMLDLQKKLQEQAVVQERLNRKLEVKREQLSRKRDEDIERIQQQIDLDILAIKNEYKFWAVLLPPIPPLLIGLIVYVRRRLREREGISRSRLR